MEDFEWPCCIRGYHIYKEIWDAAIGEHLTCERENSNNHDRYAVAVTKDRTIVGHLPRKVSRVCSLFLKRGGIDCVVTGRWRYSLDLRQGGLEVRVNYYLLLKQIIIFKSLIIHCTINFASGIFKVGSTYEIILTAKLSRSTVVMLAM